MVAALEITTRESLNYAKKSLGPTRFLDPSSSLILYIMQKTLGDPTTSLALLGLPYAATLTTATTELNKSPAHIPLNYYDFLDVFGKVKANTLPPYRPCVDYTVNLLPG